ncbi:alpha/beta fold hydrolase [Paraburkholderia caledonica]
MNHKSFWVDCLGVENRYYDAGGIRTRCLEAGNGQPLILLHGVTGHAETWIKNVGALSEFFHVYALDMLGHGFTAKPVQDYSIEKLADHVCAFMDAAGIESAVMVGQSLGGWVAGWLAVHHPARVIAYISVTGAGLEVSPSGAELTQNVGEKVRAATARATKNPTRESVRARLEWLMFDKNVVTDELVDVRYAIYTLPDFAAIAERLVSDLTTSNSRAYLLTPDRLRMISVPSLIFWTRQNPTMPWQVGEEASKFIPSALFYIMEDAGHWPQFEKPEEFNEVLLNFLLRGQFKNP